MIKNIIIKIIITKIIYRYIFFLEMSGTGDDLSLVYWTQKWLENGTLYFHVSLHMREHTSISTSPTMSEPVQELDEQLHVLHVSVMVSVFFPEEIMGCCKRAIDSRQASIYNCISPSSEIENYSIFDLISKHCTEILYV